MKKQLLFSILSLTASLYATGQSKINLAGQMILDTNKRALTHGSSGNESEDKEYCVFVTLSDKSDVSDITAAGYNVISDFGNIVTVSVGLKEIESLSRLEAVEYIEFGESQSPLMDYARPAGKVNEVQEGFTHDGNKYSFDGTGVVVGMMDTGLEGHHLNFQNEDGSTRIKRLWWFDSTNGTAKQYAGLMFRSFTTDEPAQSHATHVAGIMGGSYNGNGTYSYINSPDGLSTEKRENAPIPYYGVAKGADLALCVGKLYDSNISNAVDNIVKYAKEQGQPCVVNLSLGSTIGPHDGSDSYSKTLGILGKEAIICISSGNDGNLPISITKNLTAGDAEVKTMFVDNTAKGIVDIWADNSDPISVKWGVYDIGSRETKFIMTVSGPSETQTVTSSGNSILGTAFSGSISTNAGVDRNNNRYHVYSNLSITPNSKESSSMLILVIEGKAGGKINVYGQSGSDSQTLFTSNSIPGFVSGSPSNSINDAACANNVIAVGAFTSRKTFGVLSNMNAYSYTGASDVNAIAPFSSWGTTFSGRSLPDVCAPGTAIISSYSRYYLSAGYESTGNMTASAKNGSNTDYWGPMQGTSMSCPFVTGTVGLWLQASPALTYEQVIDVIKNTSDFNVLSMRPADRWGAGKINALEGIRYILQKYAANGAVWEDDDQRLVVSFNGSGYDVTMAGEAQFTVTVYDIQGRPVASARGLDGQASVTTSELTPGVYVLAAQGASSRLTRKVTVR